MNRASSALVASPPGLSSSHAGVAVLAPPAWLLEKQVRISVLQLYVPLPPTALRHLAQTLRSELRPAAAR